MSTATIAHPEETLFSGAATWHVPVTADRYDTKKKAGSSDSYNTADEIET